MQQNDIVSNNSKKCVLLIIAKQLLVRVNIPLT